MWLKKLFGRQSEQKSAPEDLQARESSIDRGIFYLYWIIGIQVLFVFGLLTVIMVIGKVISTPWWVFLAALVLFAGSIVYIYRKARKQFRKLRDTLGQTDLSDRNYEISIMGGMLTMRIEHNPQKLLNGPARPEPARMEPEAIEVPPNHKPVHLS